VGLNRIVSRKLFFYFVILVLTLVVLEVFAFALQFVVDREDFFDHRHTVLEHLNNDDLALFRKEGGDPVLGWRNYGPRIQNEVNCLGEKKEYSYNVIGARLYSQFEPATTEIVIVGDSYTNGDEAEDDETYSAELAKLLNTSVANHGVGGYGPTQSFLNLKRIISHYPQAKIVVLAIMYENLYRMVNSYRSVLYSTSAYTLKPYMLDGEIQAHPGAHALEDIEYFKQMANRSFDNDFWAKPDAGFPYMVSLAEALSSNYFIYWKTQKLLRVLRYPEYSLIFQDENIRTNLIRLLNRYAEYANSLDFKAVVIFIPRNRHDTQSASRYLHQSRSELHPNLLIGDVGAKKWVDWIKFNLQEEDGAKLCHPSTYGYQTIAEYIAEFMRAEKVWPVQ